MEQALILGRYRPLADIGEGGHGTVTLAFDTKMARRVAIKRIPLSHAGVRRLGGTTGLAEARTSAMLNHPNIITVHEWDTDLDEAFLIMEHVDGVSLAQLLDAYAPLDADEAAGVLAPICSALSFAHDNGVLHLDLKPENVLVTRDGLVKVGDFGVASLTNAAGQAISAGGTLGYMPPEQLRGEAVDVRSDVWALGALAYEVVTGAVPFASDTVEGALYKAESVVPPTPGDFIDTLPPEADEVLLTALSPEPADRYPAAEAFAADLLPSLGDAATGRDGLKTLVAELVAEEEPGEDTALRRLGLWDRLARWEPVLRRAAAALVCGWMAWAGLTTIGLEWAVSLAAAAVVALAAAFAPQAGLAVGLIVLAAGGFTLSPLVGAFAAVAGAVWWAAFGRRGGWEGFVPFLAPLFGVFGLGPALPLLIGFFMPGTWAAVASGAMAGLVAALASGSGAIPAGLPAAPGVTYWLAFPGAPMHALEYPLRTAQTYAQYLERPLPLLVMVACWAAAAGIMSLLARRATRPAAVAGAITGAVVSLTTVGPWMTGGQRIGMLSVVQWSASLILVFVVIALGPPVGAEQDE